MPRDGAVPQSPSAATLREVQATSRALKSRGFSIGAGCCWAATAAALPGNGEIRPLTTVNVATRITARLPSWMLEKATAPIRYDQNKNATVETAALSTQASPLLRTYQQNSGVRMQPTASAAVAITGIGTPAMAAPGPPDFIA